MTSRVSLGRPATLADLEALPAEVKGEIIEGVLYTMPRPRIRHSRAAGAIFRQLSGPYDHDADGPGGWWILIEPGIEQPDSPEFAPDLGGWRRDRFTAPPPGEPIRILPDWICEILSPSNRRYDSPSNRRYDRHTKFPYYARVGVPYLWAVDTDAHTVEIRKLIDGRWSEIAVFADDDRVRAEPFEEVEIPIAQLWLP